MPIVQTVISDIVSPRERGQYQAYFSGVWVAAGISGPVLGGLFAEHLHWSVIFWINVPLALGALAMLLPKMAKIPVFHRRRQVDWLGGLLLMASAVLFMLVLTWGGNRFLWLSPAILGMVGGSFALALTFVWHARRAREPAWPRVRPGSSCTANQIADLREGEVLVAPMTAPSWAPVFGKIAATVTDVGGIMSHAAIVCREYGLPAVTGTALSRPNIKTGQRVRVRQRGHGHRHRLRPPRWDAAAAVLIG